jgi:hypothetical protein
LSLRTLPGLLVCLNLLLLARLLRALLGLDSLLLRLLRLALPRLLFCQDPLLLLDLLCAFVDLSRLLLHLRTLPGLLIGLPSL